MSELRMLWNVGDMQISWSRTNDDEVNTARETFEKKIKEGWSAFKEKNGEKGEKIKTFDKCADRIILVPPIIGGQY